MSISENFFFPWFCAVLSGLLSYGVRWSSQVKRALGYTQCPENVEQKYQSLGLAVMLQ